MNGSKQPGTERIDGGSLAEVIARHGVWYHTLELAPGITTPGAFDLRSIVELLPWPDVRGKRCLDVGPYDGYFSFELERRGASEVIAADIGDPAEWDWPAATRAQGSERLREIVGSDPGAGFAIARDALGSGVERVELSAYDLSPERIGEFDLVVCGSLLLHLKDPVRALEAIRSVVRGQFLSSEQISPGLTLLSRRRPLAQIRGGDRMQWSIPNSMAHRKLVEAAGFEIERSTRPFAIPLGSGHPFRDDHALRTLPARTLTRLITRGRGMPHAAILARPV